MLDVQNSVDYRKIPIANVGIKDVRLPLVYSDKNIQKTTVQSVGTFSLFVSLPQEKKGTHMSRFLSLLYDFTASLSQDKFLDLSSEIRKKLESKNSNLKLTFPFFLRKLAPVSRVEGILDVDVSLEVENTQGVINNKLSVAVPIKSLCPCSKAISQYGAHSQRGIITIHVWNCNLSIEDCVRFAEESASSPIFSVLKREDEKYITELAYNTPRFVEDLVRETAFALKEKSDCSKFEVTAENFESIHNHNAWASVRSEDIL